MKSKKGLIIIIVAVIVIGGGVFAYLNFFANKDDESSKPVQTTFFQPGEFLVTNLKDGDSLIKLTVTLGVTEDIKEEELTKNIPMIRDRIVYIMRGHGKEDFQDSSSLDALSQEMCGAINAELGVDCVMRIYFYDFVIQG